MSDNTTVTQRQLCELCGAFIFGKEYLLPEAASPDALLEEAMGQAIVPIVCSAFKRLSIKSEVAERVYLPLLSKNIRLNYNHLEIAELLREKSVQYIFIKGVASANYYEEPELRTMGDIDILINPEDIMNVNDALISLGYKTDDDLSDTENHIAYTRQEGDLCSICEVHCRIKGIPIALRERFAKHLEGIFENAKEIEVAKGKCLVPCDLHHGIILLLHTANHLTSEGVGLRHLCDWAVFVNSFSNGEFINIFEKPLKELGLFTFARLLTLCCTGYLSAEKKDWAGNADEGLLDEIISDILSGGNFGARDSARFGQIKYIKDRSERSLSKKSSLIQLFSSINDKAKIRFAFLEKCKLLLPIGWLAVIFDYLCLVLSRKRRPDSFSTLEKANHRKNIYESFELFECEK